MLLKDYLSEWLNNYKIQLSANTIRGYQVNIRHICKYIGNVEIQDLNYMLIQNCYTELLKTLSNTSVLYCHRVLNLALKRAEMLDLIKKNPCQFVYAPKRNKKNFSVLSEIELSKLFNAVKGTWLYLPVMLSAVLGLRRGEVLALRWSDIDFENNILTVNHSACMVDNEFTLCNTKTEKSNRSILLSNALSDYLYTSHLFNRSEYICTRHNEPISPNVLNKHFKKTVEKLNLPYIRFHDLRHTNATLLLKKGIPAKIVSERLGHSSISITLDTYSHVLVEMQKDSSLVFDDLI